MGLSDCGGDGGAAVTTDVKRFEDLSHSIRILLESDTTRAERIDAGRRRARDLTWGTYARMLQEVYGAALAQG